PSTAPTPAAPVQAQAPANTQAAPAAEPSAAEQPQPAAQPQAPVTTSANPGAELKIYDTSAQPLDQVLAQVQKDGASIV
ncbi:penicillin-binding protein activator, partial [Escherichia coli]